MKYLMLSCLIFVGCASTPFEGWARDDTLRQTTYAALHIADWAQTREIAANPHMFYEINGLIGKHPSRSDVDRYMGASLLTTTLIVGMLKPEYRKMAQWFGIGVKVGLISNNLHVGIRISN